MAEATSETRLIQDYEAVRRREYELITGLLDLLPRVDNLGEQRVSQVRDALFHADHPYLMVLVGQFNSGKSSIINALLGAENFLRIGPVPTTDRISILRWGEVPQDTGGAGDTDTLFYPSPLLKKLSLVDTPGLESVFTHHEETTRQFLHRADVVLLVMLATQAMTQSNLDYLRMFREYGKKVILVINQCDLLSAEERISVRDYVRQQSKDRLGSDPEIWMVSARAGIDARAGGTLDQQLWQESGLWQIETFIEKQLQDVDRLRQKLQTPLQIVQTVHKGAVEVVRRNQSTFDRYRSVTDNITQQLTAQKREQEKIVREINSEVEAKFRETGDRSREAIADIFRFSRAFSSLGRGLLELSGLAQLLRRADAPSYVEAVFKRYKIFEPIADLPAVVDKLAPRLEGQDMQDIDDLVRYGNKEIQNLPVEMRDKLIGTVQAPARYDRSFLQDVRRDLAEIEQEARTVETQKLDQIRRNTLFYLAVWELFIVMLMVALFNTWSLVNSWTDMPLSIILLIVLLACGLVGFIVLPLRGRIIHTEYVNRLLKLQAKYTQVLTTAADKQIEYGMQLRREAIVPVTRLIESQAQIQDQQLARLRQAEMDISSIESALNTLGKRKILGMTL